MAQGGRDMQVAGEAITQAHDTIRKAYDFQQVGSAKLKALEGMTALEQKAQEDGDNTGDLTHYNSEMNRIKSDVLGGITNPAVRSKFELDFDLQAAQTRTQITAQFRRNMVGKGLANLDTMNKYFMNEYAQSGDASYLEDMGRNIDTYVSENFINADDAQKIKDKTTKDARHANFIYDMQSNPAVAGEKLASNAYGFDVEKLGKAKAQYDREINKIQNDNEEALELKKLNNEPIDINSVIDQANKEKIRPKFASTFLKNITDPKINIKTDPSTYENIMNMIMSNNTKASVIRDAIESARGSKLSDSDADSLYYVKHQGKDVSVYKDFYDETHKSSVWWQSAINYMKGAAVNTFNNMAMFPILMNSFITQSKGMSPEKVPELAVKVINDKFIEENPEIKDFPKGRVGIDRATGVKYRFFPDGHKERIE